MKERRRQNAYINNLGLREVDARIINVRAIEPEAQADMSYAARPTRPGQTLLRRLRRSKIIQIQFMIRELYDLAARNAVIDAVNAWARDGVLEISTRPDQMAQVIVTKYASAADIRGYTDAYTVEFEACGVPYWQDKTPARLELSSTASSGWLAGDMVVGGNADTIMDAISVKPTSGALTGLTVALYDPAGNRTSYIWLAALSVPTGGTLELSHDADGILRITADGVSVLGNRTPDSYDELVLRPGRNVVSVLTDNAACDMTFTARGWYR